MKALAEYGAPISDLTVEYLASDDAFFQIGVAPVRIDILGNLIAVQFPDCWDRRLVAQVDGMPVNFIGIRDLIKNKEASGRPVDLFDVELLKNASIYLAMETRPCTPNDLFDWREDGKTVVQDTHALRTLKRETPARSVADMTRDIPAEKLEKLGEMLAELNNGSEGAKQADDASNDA